MQSLFSLDLASYQPSALHRADRVFRETNCYIDVWIELLHAAGIDPVSAMAFACAIDFEGDQWTFSKPQAEDLERLYGIDVHEMQLYRPLLDHLDEQLRAGRTMIIEVDSFYLPDTTGTAYRAQHVKSSIAIEALDAGSERLRYFHGTGCYQLSGEDFRGVFRLGREFSADVLPPYAELVRFDRGPRLTGEALREAARSSLARHLARRPLRNPWLAFGERLTADLPSLLSGSEDRYHAYAFATVRQCGAALELLQSFVAWLAPEEDVAVSALARQAAGAKTMLFRLARRKAFDPQPAIDSLASDWDSAVAAMERIALGEPVSLDVVPAGH